MGVKTKQMESYLLPKSPIYLSGAYADGNGEGGKVVLWVERCSRTCDDHNVAFMKSKGTRPGLIGANTKRTLMRRRAMAGRWLGLDDLKVCKTILDNHFFALEGVSRVCVQKQTKRYQNSRQDYQELIMSYT